MRIGILGTRGIPNAYGGFEQFAQYLAEGLVQRGHEVAVYNSHLHPYTQSSWNGIRIIHCRDLEDKLGTAGQFIYDLNCLKDARKQKFDILLQLGYTSNSLWHRLWPKDTVNIVNMDGLEWKRTKYTPLIQQFLKQAERWAARRGDWLVADSIGIQQHLRQQYGKASVYIPYGADVFTNPEPGLLHEWKLEPDNYCLLIARMEPENNIELIIRGYMDSDTSMPLVLVGNTGNKFGRYLRARYTSSRLLFTEGIYDAVKINNLRYHSALYFHGHSVGGTNPSLLEAMGCSCFIAAHRNGFNKAILNEEAFYFETSTDISRMLQQFGSEREKTERFRQRNLEKVRSIYSWEKIISEYERLFTGALRNSKGGATASQ